MSNWMNFPTPTILIVDDKPSNLQLLLEFLKKAGYKILIAQTGQKAIETAVTLHPNLILLDVMMNELDGFDTCRQLKSNSSTKNIPIIFLTVLTTTINKIKGFELGAVDYVTKPIDETELLARIRTHLSLQSLHQRLAREVNQRKLIWDISDRIRRSLDLNIILETATKEIRSFLECDFVGLLALSDRQIEIKAYSAAENLKLELQNTLTLDYLCPNPKEYEFYLQGNFRVLEAQEKNYCPITSLQPPQTRLIVPLVIDRKTLWGWLIVDQYRSFRHWFPEEISLIQELTTQLAIAIKQGLLHRKLSNLALLDSLTQVYNRRYFERQFNLEWRRLRRIPSPLSLIMCDVDCFKMYNDTYGHQQGDKCLQQVAKAISSAIKRPADIVARYGGEEFVVILPHTPQSGAIKVAESMRVAVKQLNIPHTNSSVNSVVTISLGVASTIPNNEENPHLLTEAADLALYQAKQHGRDCLAVYTDSISHARDKQDLETAWVKRLRQALHHNLFSLYAQPISPLIAKDGKKYFEILLRLTDEKNRAITPSTFLEVAERNFLMPEIDTWVVNNLLEKLATHKERVDWQNYRFSINLSGASLNNESFLEFLTQKLSARHFPPELFCFEITENIAVAALDNLTDFIHTLKNLGCSFALDDFGKGMSSLNYLQNLPVDYLKIDGSFVREINNKKTAKVMIEAMHHIAEGMGLKTIAEFVEDRAILETIRELKIDYAQGFHLGRPGILMDTIG